MATKKKAADAEEKKKRKKRPAYKEVTYHTDFGAVSDAYNALEELGQECREIVDNASEGLQQTQRIQTLESTADTLEGISEPNVPDCLSNQTFSYSDMVPTNKRQSPSRAVRCQNACSLLSAAVDQASALLEECKERRGTPEAGEDDITEDQEGEVETFIEEAQSIIDECESLEFPGMFG